MQGQKVARMVPKDIKRLRISLGLVEWNNLKRFQKIRNIIHNMATHFYKNIFESLSKEE